MIPEDFQEIISNMTENAREGLQRAEFTSREFNTGYIGTEHILLGLLSVKSSLAAQAAGEVGLTFTSLHKYLSENPIPSKNVPEFTNPNVKALSESAVFTLRMSWEISQEYQQEHLGTEHILNAILQQNKSRTSQIIAELGIDTKTLLSKLVDMFARDEQAEATDKHTSKQQTSRTMTILNRFGEDLTAKARNGEIDKIVSRKKEVKRLITVLLRRTKSNPVLIGEAGVGKTAVVELLAQKIVAEDVPPQLLDKKVYEIDLALMLSGTKYRGEFEERLKNVIKALEKHQDVIAFIDEIHLLTGTGAAEGAMDAANILKPALARGKVRLIGATTFDEFKKSIEKDSALDRRFQPVRVDEPTSAETLEILKGLRPGYEAHHHVKISDETLKETVFMADRYVFDRFMPDKAIDILDESAALLSSEKTKKPGQAREIMREIELLNDKQTEAVNAEDYERAALYKTRISQMQKKLDEEERVAKDCKPLVLNSDYIARAISSRTGIPVEKISHSEAKILQNLEKYLGKKIIGQKEAVEKVSRAIRRNKSGISAGTRPIGSFIFLGPTGVGKTELARVLASEVFGSQKALIKIDMSEFSEKHKTAQLLGAPAGYVGYEDGGTLTEKIRRQPYSVVLFDEIEKAHPDTFNLLLQLLEDGELTDSKGRKVSFKNSIIILTSNLGANEMMKESALGFEVNDQKEQSLAEIHTKNEKFARRDLEKMLRPELLNRFDGIITFEALTKTEISKIFDNLIKDLNDRLIHQGLHIKVKQSAKKLLIDKGFDAKNGARPLRRTIEDQLEHKIAEGILSGEFHRGLQLVASVNNNEIVVSPIKE